MSTQREHASNLPRSAALGVGDHESCTGLIAKSAQVTRRGSASSVYQRGPRRTAKADGRRRGPQLAATFAAAALGRWSEGGEGARKVDKHRTEGGSHRPISAPSMWIVCHEALRAGPFERSGPPPNPVRGVSPNTEGGQTADGRWNPPTNFGPLVGDLLDMRNSTPMPRPQLSGAIGGRLWPPP